MKIVLSFLKDHVLDYVSNMIILAVLLLYFRLVIGHSISIVYPMVLVLFITGVITVMKFISYYRFYIVLRLGNDKDYMIQGGSEQSRECLHRIHEIHHFYQRELSHQKDQKEQTNAFIAQMAHDMKIPLSVINLLLEERSVEEDSYRIKLIEDIKGEADKLQDKLSQQLCYLRLGKFEKDYLIEASDLVAEVRNAINNKKEFFILNHIFPKLICDQEKVMVLTDPKWNGMLLDQLISNGIKYSAIKGIENRMEFHLVINDRFVELSIIDFGIGIPDYDLGRVFEPFFTGENGRRTKNSTGIGLYLCKIIADKLGHSISVTSERGKSTTVKLCYLSKM